jgi:hypothetical protein
MSSPELREEARKFDNVVIFYNDCSSDGDDTLSLVRRRLEDTEYGPRFEYVKTSPHKDETREIFLDKIGDSDQNKIAGIIGGDGTINDIVRILEDPEVPDKVSATPIWTPGGGNARNLFHSVTAKRDYKHPEHVLETGVIDQFFPLSCSISTPGVSHDLIHAATILGFGGTAIAAGELNHIDHRSSWLRNLKRGDNIADPIAVLKGLMKSRKFDTIDSDGHSTNLFEKVYLNGPRAAKIIRARGVHLTGPALRIEIVHKNPFDIGSTLAKLAIGRSVGSTLVDPDIFSTRDDEIFCQADGEEAYKIDGRPNPLPPNSTVTVTYSKRPIRVVTTLTQP